MLFDPTLSLFSNHWEAGIFFGGAFIYVFVLCLLSYIKTKDKEGRKDILAAWITLDAMFAIGIGIAAYFAVQAGV